MQVARCSLPSIQPTGHNNGGITNLIPFKGLNLMVLTHVVLFTIYWLLVYTYNLTMAKLGLLEHATVPKAVGNTAVRTRGFILTLAAISLLLTNRKAKEYTRRKATGWWDHQVLMRLSSHTQPVAIQQAANQPTATSLAARQLIAVQLAATQPADSSRPTSQPADLSQASRHLAYSSPASSQPARSLLDIQKAANKPVFPT